MDARLIASNGPPRKPSHKRFVDSVQRVARAPFTALAREEVRVAIDGVEVLVMVERQERPRGGWQVYWRAPCCDRRWCHLFVVPSAPAGSALTCRKCFPGGLTYRSQHVLNPALIRAAKIRRKLGAAPGVLSKLPRRPAHWRSDYWQQSMRDLAAAERVIAELLNATLREVKRRKARFDDGR
jgi:hypothetical protein